MSYPILRDVVIRHLSQSSTAVESPVVVLRISFCFVATVSAVAFPLLYFS